MRITVPGSMMLATLAFFFIAACSPEPGVTKPQKLANPAAVYCAEQGGTSKVEQTTAGAVGYCHLPDGRVIDEWEYFRASQQQPAAGPATSADTIYIGGPILTMDGASPTYVEAVAVSNGVITYAGAAPGVEAYRGEHTVTRDLGGKAMLPGFIDPHGHFMFALNMVNQVNVALPPVGPVEDIPSLIATLNAWQDNARIPEEGWIVGWGYDHTGLKEGRHVTREDLDEHFPKHKVMIIHVSGHGAVLNSNALAWAGVDASTDTPAGGIINRLPNSQEPAGLLMETAYLPIFAKLPQPSEAELMNLMKPAQMMYAREGYVHAQEGFSHIKDVKFLQKAAAQGRIFLDIVSLPGFTEFDTWKDDPAFSFGTYNNNFKLQGIKFTQDGSPQGRTAYVTEPYLTGGPGGQENWRGETSQPRDAFIAQVNAASERGLQVFIHANGDATIDEAIDAVRAAGLTAADDRRTVVVHSQFQRPDQLDKYVELGMSPSYFTNHTYFWGDVHVRNIGEAKASFISPIKSATDKGLVFSNHTDFNITPLDPFFVMWSAMARQTRQGHTLGPDQRVDAYTALQGLTTGPAWQIFEEERKGKIKAGMLANFVILSADPVTTSTDDIRNIEVLETIKQGVTLYPARDEG